MKDNALHISEDLLEQYLFGTLPDAELESLEEHLARMPLLHRHGRAAPRIRPVTAQHIGGCAEGPSCRQTKRRYCLKCGIRPNV